MGNHTRGFYAASGPKIVGPRDPLADLMQGFSRVLKDSTGVIERLSPACWRKLMDLIAREAGEQTAREINGEVAGKEIVCVSLNRWEQVFRETCFSLSRGLMQRAGNLSVRLFFDASKGGETEHSVGILWGGDLSDADFDCRSRLRSASASSQDVFSDELQEHAVLTPPRLAALRESALLNELIGLVHRQSRVDFSGYKRSSLWRGIYSRMAQRGAGDIAAYLDLARHDEQELHLLSGEFLVPLTALFRDPEAFAYLRNAMQELMAAKGPEGALRLWVPGCASGEEAVSLAILVADLQWQSLSRRPIEILATDVKLSALRQARSFCYSAEQLRDLPEDMVERYFERQQGHFRLRQDLRDWLRFEHHDLAKDPPYLNLDLVSCRNVLMYFDPQLQELVLDKFRHGLNAGGLLFLGNSESVLQQSEGFETVHYPARLFRVH